MGDLLRSPTPMRCPDSFLARHSLYYTRVPCVGRRKAVARDPTIHTKLRPNLAASCLHISTAFEADRDLLQNSRILCGKDVSGTGFSERWRALYVSIWHLHRIQMCNCEVGECMTTPCGNQSLEVMGGRNSPHGVRSKSQGRCGVTVEAWGFPVWGQTF